MTSSRDSWTPLVVSRKRSEEFTRRIADLARENNLAVATTQVCPQCQVWDKLVGHLFVIQGRIMVEGQELSGVLVIMCDDCIKAPNIPQMVKDLNLWMKSGFASVHYVLAS